MSELDRASVERIPLYDVDVEPGAKMVPFAGSAVPVQYRTGSLPSTPPPIVRRRRHKARYHEGGPPKQAVER